MSHRVELASAFTAWMLLTFTSMFLAWFLPVLIAEAFGAASVGVLYSLVGLIVLPFVIVGGGFVDVAGRGLSMLVGSVLVALSVYGIFFLNALVLGLIGFSLGAFLVGASVKLLALEAVAEEKRGLISGLLQVVAGGCGAFSSALLPSLPLEAARTILLAASLLLTVPSLVLAMISGKRVCWRVIGEALKAAARAPGVAKSNPWLLLLIAPVLLGGGIAKVYFPVFIESFLGVPTAALGAAYSALYVLSSLVVLASGALLARIGEWRLAAVAACGLAASTLALASSPTGALGLALLVAIGAFEAVMSMIFPVLVVNEVGFEERGLAMSFIHVVSGISDVLAPILGSAAWILNPRLTIGLAAVFFAASAAYVLARARTGLIEG